MDYIISYRHRRNLASVYMIIKGVSTYLGMSLTVRGMTRLARR